MPKVFASKAPPTVRAGSIGVLLLTMVDVCVGLGWLRVSSTWEVGLWYGFLRPGFRLLAGLAFAWGISQMLGVFYWCWLVISTLVGPLVVITSFVRMLSHSEGIGAVTFGPVLIVTGVLWLLTTVFLLSPASLRAYWRHGRLWVKSAVQVENAEPPGPDAG